MFHKVTYLTYSFTLCRYIIKYLKIDKIVIGISRFFQTLYDCINNCEEYIKDIYSGFFLKKNIELETPFIIILLPIFTIALYLKITTRPMKRN